jgi:hypothetical protein
MPITAINWGRENGRDIHLVAGQSISPLIDDRLVFTPVGGPNVMAGVYQASHSDVNLKFVPIFRPQSTSGDFVVGHGITVNTRTGAVSIAGTLPAQRKPNFLIEAQATNSGSPDVFRARIRVHVHKSVKPNGLWLSPAQLTVRADTMLPSGETHYRFSVRAEFDDDVVGDLTVGHGVTWGPANVTPEGRIIVPAGAAPGSTFSIRATLPAFGGLFAEQNVVIHTPWASDPNRPVAEPIAGGGFPAGVPIESVPNVVFVSAGHELADRNDFVSVTTRVVARLRQLAILEPFNRLTPSMNFWRIFLPGASRSLSSPGDLALLEIDGTLKGYAQPVVVAPRATGPLDYRNLLYLAGYPVRTHRRIPAETAAQTAAAIAAIRAEWAVLTEVDLTRVTDVEINQWRNYADRAFLEEYDAFPGVSVGEVATANLNFPTFLNLHSDRAGRAGLDALFSSVSASSGVTLSGGANVGTLWASSSTSFAFENFRYVVLISPYGLGRAHGGDQVLMPSPPGSGQTTVFQRLAPHREVRATGGVKVVLVETSYVSTMAHELAHQFHLGDEYADIPLRSNATVADLARIPNLQADAGARDAAGKLSGEEIKWNWHRIAKAAPVAGTITINIVNGTFAIPVAPGTGSQFVAGEDLFLRARPPRTPLDKTTPVLSTLLKVLFVAPNTVTVKSGGLAITDIDPYQKGSIVFLPAPTPADDAPGPDPHARLVSNRAKAFIDAMNMPFTGPVCADPALLLGTGPQNPKTLVPPSWLRCNKDLPAIIGLYEGGLRRACGIYHPSGICKMRDNPRNIAEFCLVCAHALADLIDPVVHADVERTYVKKLKKP